MTRWRIGFIGLGKLGLDAAEVFAESHEVRGYDIEPRTSDSVVITSLKETIEHSDWIFIAVPTPHAPGYDGSVPSSHMRPQDFEYEAVYASIDAVNQLASTPKRVVLISTVLPGTMRKKIAIRLNRPHQLLYNPYLIAMGSIKWDMVNPEMIIIGTDHGDSNWLSKQLQALYQPMMRNNPRFAIGTWEEAEAIKIFYNTFISAKVGLANMIQDFAMKIGNINVDVVTDALACSNIRITGPKYMTAGMGDAGACHPRDNIALRWLAQEYDLGYDIFDTIMLARERQARNLAAFLIDVSTQNLNLPMVIHGKAYKPDVPYCIGSYSTLVGHYVRELGAEIAYIDPLADDVSDVVEKITESSVILMAHNRSVTYGYTGHDLTDRFYCEIPRGSVLVDPWRRLSSTEQYQVIHYGNTRKHHD